MGSFGEEVERSDAIDFVFSVFGEEFDVAGLSGGVAGEVDEFFRFNFEEFFY